MALMQRMAWRFRAFAVVAGLGATAGLSGPLFPFTPQPSGVAEIAAKVPDLDAYLYWSEARHAEVRPDLIKEIVWHDPVRRGRTPVALVYLHGFSASRRDIAPVVESLAGLLGANAFFTRLAAHGRATPDEFATVTPQDWLDDAREALAIGRRIGDRVIVIGMSTGALLATIAAIEDNSPELAALVLLSPNFALRDWRAKFISGPIGPWIARIIIGRDYSFRPDSAGHAEFWTTRFPSRAIAALMDLVNYARSIHLASLAIPTLIIFTEGDTIVDTEAIVKRFDEIRSPAKLIVDLPEATRHELTGDALAPQTVRPVVELIATFLFTNGVLGPAIPK